jgi:peptide/nickel transport system substrate-binding protein
MMRAAGASRLAVLVTSAALICAGCGGSSSSGGGNSSGGGTPAKGGGAVRGGTFRIAANDGIDSMNPFTAINSDSHNAFQNIYSFLVQYDTRTFDYTGDLATSWKPSKGGADWTFKLRPGVKWSDGQPLDATDVADVMNWATKLDGLGLVGEIFGGHLQRAEATDAQTLVLHYDQPVAVVLSKMAKWPVLPPQVWTRFKTAAAASGFQNTNPVVSGPFTVARYAKRSILLTKANPAYYGRKPLIDGWGLKQYDNVDAQLQALSSGEIDAVEAVPGSAFQSLKRNGSLTVVATPSSFVSDFIINANPNKTTHRELLQPKVREAFADAIDKQALVRLIHAGQGQPADSIVPKAYGDAPGTGKPWHAPGLPQDSYDPARANQLLDGLGYKRGPGGVRVANGAPMSYTVIVPTDAYTGVTRVSDLFKRWFSAIGVRLSIKPEDSAAAYNEIIGTQAATKTPKNSYLKFDLSLWNWTSRPDPESILLVTTTSQYGALSDSGYSNPTYDRLYQRQFSEIDPKKRLAILWRMQRILAADRAYIPLVWADKLQAWSKKWTGLRETPQGFFNESSNENLLTVHQVGG